ncbi:MAG: TMEM175 family protein, partial [Candidatus Sulfotelmatobacter sp.]
MHSLYNRVAGQNVDRIAALSDGIFAVAMTLLVLDLRIPAAEAIHSEHDLRRALIILVPRLVIFLMSIMTNGIFWVGQQTQLNYIARSDRNLAWIHIAFLCAVSLTPFTTSLLA